MQNPPDAGTPGDSGQGLPADAGGGVDGGVATDAGGGVDGGSFAFDGGAFVFPIDAGACTPLAPRAVVDFTMPMPSRTVALGPTDDLQAALDAAAPGDELVLPAGAVYTGNYLLKPKSGAGWITVRSSASANLPPLGSRISPATDVASMARIQTSNSAPAITAQSAAGGWRFVGIEVGIQAGVSLVYNLVELGDATQTTVGQLPHDIIFDRCWVHANDTGDARRGIALNGVSIGVIGCSVDNFKEVGADSQSVGGWSGAGPFTIVNNYLEAAAETVLFGGSDPSVPNLVPSDIALIHNTLSKRLTWKATDPSYAGVAYVVKNVLEFKNAQRVWVEGNIIERSWPMGQVGYAFLVTPRNQDNTAPWSTVQDLTFVNNVVREAAGGFNFLSADDGNLSQPSTRLLIWNNLFYDIGTAQWGSDPTFQFLHGQGQATCWTVGHLTADNGGSLGAIGDTPVVVDQFQFVDSVMGHGAYGLHGNNTGEGTVALTTYSTNYSFTGNAIYGGGSGQYPAGNSYPADLTAVDFVDAANHDYHLASTSPYKGTAADGTDPGADIDRVMAATQ